MWLVKKTPTAELMPRDRHQQVDIRLYFKRHKTNTGSLLLSNLLPDDTPTATNLDEPTTLLLLGTRLHRTCSLTRTRLQSQEPTANHHSYFKTHRWRQDQLGQKRLRTPICTFWDKVAGLEWLQSKDLHTKSRAEQLAEGPQWMDLLTLWPSMIVPIATYK